MEWFCLSWMQINLKADDTCKFESWFCHSHPCWGDKRAQLAGLSGRDVITLSPANQTITSQSWASDGENNLVRINWGEVITGLVLALICVFVSIHKFPSHSSRFTNAWLLMHEKTSLWFCSWYSSFIKFLEALINSWKAENKSQLGVLPEHMCCTENHVKLLTVKLSSLLRHLGSFQEAGLLQQKLTWGRKRESERKSHIVFGFKGCCTVNHFLRFEKMPRT